MMKFMQETCVDFETFKKMFFHFSCFLGHLHSQHTAVENCVRDFVNVSVGLEANYAKMRCFGRKSA